jgi:4-hydroxybenzoyl-CoA reductase subunit beta
VNLPHFDFHAPPTLAACAKLLETCGSDAELLAGGTDLFVRMKYGLAQPSHLVSLADVDELNGISHDDGRGLVLGAGARLATLLGMPAVTGKYPAIAEAASLVATRQVRHMATLGGNLLQHTRCLYYNRSPVWGKAVPACIKRGGDVCHVVTGSKRCFAVYQGDMAPVLIALGATLTFVSRDKTDETSLESIFTGDGKTPFRNTKGKILARISVPDAPSPRVVRYNKYRLRNGIDFPLAGVAMALSMDGDTITDLRLCLTGVWSSPVLVTGVREMAAGRKLTAALATEVAHAAYEAAHPLPNTAGTPERRRSMLLCMVEDMLLAET